MEDQRNNGLHPRHPGVGCSTSIIAVEAMDGDPEIGGFLLFLPSGATKIVTWRQAKPIEPTLDAAKQYAGKLIETLYAARLDEDIKATNWVSVTAAIQRIILDWNDRIKTRISIKMADEFGPEARRLRSLH